MTTTTERKNRIAYNAIILLDKSQGMSSNFALQKVKRLLNAKKAGHTGSLDPLATGMLPICLGQATKFSQYLLEADKVYRVTGRLGIQTTTADAEGDVVSERPIPELSAEQLEPVLQNFRGKIQQIPSMYSALKHQGKPLYQWAREGVTIDRPAREVTISKLELLNLTTDSFELEIACSKGTYVRNLVEDIGEALGCGAHVSQLRRLTVADYQVDAMVTFEQLEALHADGQVALQPHLLPISTMVSYLPVIEINSADAFRLKQGQDLVIPMMHGLGMYRVMADSQFCGLAEVCVVGKLTSRKMVG